MTGKGSMEKRYFFDPYRVEFSAKVTFVEKLDGGCCAAYLDNTYFYPESGGQPNDLGLIADLEVLDVREDERGVRHVVRGVLAVGDEVSCTVDWKRRFDHMQQHSGQHLISRVFEDEFGFKTVSFHLGRRASTIDLDTTGVTEEMLRSVEGRVNELVWKGIPIRSEILTRDEFLKRTGEDGMYAKLRSKLPGDAVEVRLVEIEGIDISTCCGTHCSSTSEIGPVRLLGVERVRGNTRVEFLCGARALADCREKDRILTELSGVFTTDWRELGRIVEKLVEENKSLRKRNEVLSKEAARARAESIADSGSRIGEYELIKRVFEESDAAEMRESAFALRDGGKRVVLFASKGPKVTVIFACTKGAPFDMGAVMKECMELYGGRGGGGKDFSQGGGVEIDEPGDLLDKAEEILKREV